MSVHGSRTDPRVEAGLLYPSVGEFTNQELDGLSDPVRRFFENAIAPGTPLAQSARFEMEGQIKVGRWLPFSASEILTPHIGFVWAARAAGLIAGSDRFLDGQGAMEWKLAGLVPVMAADGPDISRSAAERAGGEAVWVPTSLLPRFGVDWEATADNLITARFLVGEHPVELACGMNGDGQIESVVLERWGDPNNEGAFDLYPFGGDFIQHGTFDGVTIPIAGSVGWHFGTDRWEEGEFFRFEITKVELVTLAPTTRRPLTPQT